MLNRRGFLEQVSGAVLAGRAGLSGPPLAAAAPGLVTVFSDPVMLRHEPPVDHPESPKRLDAVMGAVRRLEREGQLSLATPRPATDDDALLVHTPEYVKKVRAE